VGWGTSPSSVEYFLHDVDTSSETHPASYPTNTRGSYPVGKAYPTNTWGSYPEGKASRNTRGSYPSIQDVKFDHSQLVSKSIHPQPVHLHVMVLN
jgi:hypothetical protein